MENSLDQDLAVYKGILEKAFASSDASVVPNSGPAHASAMLSTMFKHAQRNICMVVGSFSNEVSGDKEYQSSFTNAVSKTDIITQVLVLDEPNESSVVYKLLVQLATNQPKRVSLRKATQASIKSLVKELKTEEDGKPIHFAFFDNDVCRLEIDTKNFGAIGFIHDQKMVTRLQEIFAEAFEKGKPLAEAPKTTYAHA